MLNKQNRGTVYFGVNDQGEVIGVDIGEDTTQSIRNLVRDMIQPQIFPEVTEHTTDDGKRYITLHARGNDVPYSYDGRYYIRNESSDESAGPEMVSRLVLAKEMDPLKNQTSDCQDLTFDLLFRMMSARKLHPKAEHGFFEDHGMIDDHGGFNLTAYLLSDQNDIQMQVVRFNGCDRASMSSRTNFGGRSLIGSLIAVIEHVSLYTVTKTNLSDGEMVETHLFDIESFNEAWINACVHNAWRKMIPPSVMIFDDRIEVISYGMTPFPVSAENFYEENRRPVNKALHDMFTLLGMTGQDGHGVRTIIQNYGRDAFHISDNGVTVTIPFAFEPDRAAICRRKS